MRASLTHRGPDDEGSYQDGGVALGMRRLSIIDVEGGHQPIHNEDESVWIVFNGEIYNHPDLRHRLEQAGHEFYTKSDTEAVVHAYEEWGDAFLERLNGMFGLALWDGRRRRLILARDRVGIKPLYYAVSGRRLSFASELKGLLQDPSLPREVDPVALDQYLALEYVPSPLCIIAGVRKLPPGHYLAWDQAGGTHQVLPYWRPGLERSEEARNSGLSLEEEAERLRHVLRESVRKELISDVPLGVFLSGGIDSSAVAAMMAQLTPGQVRSFSVGFADSSFDESRYARLVARHLGTEHRELVLEPEMLFDLVPTVTRMLDEPMADASIIPTFLLSRFTREHVKVALGGDGGDELFAGYPTLQAHRLAGWYGRLPGPLARGLVPAAIRRLPVSMDNLSFDYRAKRFVDGALRPVGERHLRWMGSFPPEQRSAVLSMEMKRRLAEAEPYDPIAAHLAGTGLRDPLNQVLQLDMKLYLENDILVKLDRATMMASLEGRVPLLNADFVEHVTGLPLRFKLHGLRSKHLFKLALRGLLPREILERPKKGFGIPVAKWFRGPLREEMLEVLSSQTLQRQGFFEPSAVQALIDGHLSGRADRRKELWTLYIFQRWHRAYIEGAAPDLRVTVGGRA
jgi:asparagine synthase (glutamine-hydrolysing)